MTLIYILLGLIPLLIGLSHLIPTIINYFSSTPTFNHNHYSFIIPSIVSHARFLPEPSSHKFKYPALFLATELNRLESGSLDLGSWFRWKGVDQYDRSSSKSRRWSVLGLIPEEYLRLSFGGMRVEREKETVREKEKEGEKEKEKGKDQDHDHDQEKHDSSNGEERIKQSILLKLVYELRSRGFLTSGPQDGDWGNGDGNRDESSKGWRSELGQVWSITMPSVLGFQGINPLTVYYCYRPGKEAEEVEERLQSHPDSNASNFNSNPNSSRTRGPFWLTVLEVHNTFSERHVYILESNVNEETDSNRRRKGYHHQWTFERSFHVSPFNDRGGYYCLMMKELFKNQEEKEKKEKEIQMIPEIDIRLLLLINPSKDSDDTSLNSSSPSTAETSETKTSSTSSSSISSSSPSSKHPDLQKKLLATLNSHPLSSHSKKPISLSPNSIFKSLSRQPLDLFLTTFRILWEAGKLHFLKRLDAFGRPDMMEINQIDVDEVVNEDEDEDEASEFDGIGLPPVLNSIEMNRKNRIKRRNLKVKGEKTPDNSNGNGNGNQRESEMIEESKINKSYDGGLLWPQESFVEKNSRERFLDFCSKRISRNYNRSKGVESVRIISTDEAVEDVLIGSPNSNSNSNSEKDSVIFIRSPSFYTDILFYSTPELALLFGSKVGRRWGVNNLETFRNLFKEHDDDNDNNVIETEKKTENQNNSRNWNWKLKMMEKIRLRHLNFSISLIREFESIEKINELRGLLLTKLSSSTWTTSTSRNSTSTTSHNQQIKKIQCSDLPPHPFSNSNSNPTISFNLLLSLFLLHFMSIIEYYLFKILSARYVEGTEPWLEIYRGLKLLERENNERNEISNQHNINEKKKISIGANEEGNEKEEFGSGSESWDLIEETKSKENPKDQITKQNRIKTLIEDKPTWLSLGSVRREIE